MPLYRLRHLVGDINLAFNKRVIITITAHKLAEENNRFNATDRQIVYSANKYREIFTIVVNFHFY